MFGRRATPPATEEILAIRCDLAQAMFAERPQSAEENLSLEEIEKIKMHLGGETMLARVGVKSFIPGPGNVTIRVSAHNPNNVKTVVISRQPDGFFKMACYGEIKPGTISAPRLKDAVQIIPENLATVLGQLTGMEMIHHHHY
jgi:hypothetical protein